MSKTKQQNKMFALGVAIESKMAMSGLVFMSLTES